MSEPAPAQPEPTPFEKMRALALHVMSVPKAEIDRRAVEAKRAKTDKRKRAA